MPGRSGTRWSANKRVHWQLRSASALRRTGATDGAPTSTHTGHGVIQLACGLARWGKSLLSWVSAQELLADCCNSLTTLDLSACASLCQSLLVRFNFPPLFT